MRIGVYGLPCSGKTTLINKFNNSFHGRDELEKISNGVYNKSFNLLTEAEKENVRKQWATILSNQTIAIADGHYSFGDQIVFTQQDGLCYDVFIYLYVDPDVLYQRISGSTKNNKYLKYDIKQWQLNEIGALRHYCHEHNCDFYVVDDPSNDQIVFDFVSLIFSNKFSSKNLAQSIVEKIEHYFENVHDIYVLDGDKTISYHDTANFLCNYKTSIFDNNFYTGYQTWKNISSLDKLVKDVDINIDELIFNNVILNKISTEKSIILTSGSKIIWETIAKYLNIPLCFSGSEMSAECKYFVVKQLKEKGYKISSFGDSLIDYYMLLETKGSIVIRGTQSRSLHNVDISSLKKIFIPYVLTDVFKNTNKYNDFCKLCEQSKSNSGIVGNELARIHFKLGQYLGNELKKVYQPTNCTIISMLRGGLFLSSGIYDVFNAHYVLYDSKYQDLSSIDCIGKTIIVVDSVINTGKQMLSIATKLKLLGYNVVIVAGVIQKDSLSLFKDFSLYVARVSENKFIGARQSFQSGLKGPDTSDRLFNFIINEDEEQKIHR